MVYGIDVYMHLLIAQKKKKKRVLGYDHYSMHESLLTVFIYNNKPSQ